MNMMSYLIKCVDILNGLTFNHKPLKDNKLKIQLKKSSLKNIFSISQKKVTIIINNYIS